LESRETLDGEELDILRKINADYEGHDVHVIPIDECFDSIGMRVKGECYDRHSHSREERIEDIVLKDSASIAKSWTRVAVITKEAASHFSSPLMPEHPIGCGPNS